MENFSSESHFKMFCIIFCDLYSCSAADSLFSSSSSGEEHPVPLCEGSSQLTEEERSWQGHKGGEFMTPVQPEPCCSERTTAPISPSPHPPHCVPEVVWLQTGGRHWVSQWLGRLLHYPRPSVPRGNAGSEELLDSVCPGTEEMPVLFGLMLSDLFCCEQQWC